MAARRNFRGVLEADGTNLAWTVIRVPFEPVEVWPQRKGLRVRGTLNGIEFRTSLFRMSDGCCVLLVNKQTQKKAGVTQGSMADVALEADTEARAPAPIPPELDKLLRQDRALRKWHDGLNPSMRGWIAAAVAQPKDAAARVRRAELWAERMMLAMEGERETPPILEALFNRQPRAREGWQALTRIQRRNHLLGIYYCQGPESRRKRAERAVAAALQALEKRKEKARRGS
jgi:uncharacterized protein YdeI (YjbR/CyaY-like superfamily)